MLTRHNRTIQSDNGPEFPLLHTYQNLKAIESKQRTERERRLRRNKGSSTYAIDRVAEPLPAFACTTSVPPSWVRLVRASISSSVNWTFGEACSDHRWTTLVSNNKKLMQEARWSWNQKDDLQQSSRQSKKNLSTLCSYWVIAFIITHKGCPLLCTFPGIF